jgi:large subunit ribosomal protein L17
MRHGKAGKKLSRTSSHRRAMWSNMVCSLITHERIETTETKAKELKRLAEKTISWGISVGELTAKGRDKLDAAQKAQVVHAMRMAGRVVKQKDALEKLFGEIAPRYHGVRQGGYTRILKTRVRSGDAVAMAYVELVSGKPEARPAKAAPEAAGAATEKKAKKPKAAKAEKSAE